jgi:hypothetical protein
MSLSKVSLNYKSGVQKGPGCDASMITTMRRQAIIVSEANARTPTNGRKGMGVVVDAPQTRGFTEGPVRPVFAMKGARLGFFKSQ